MKGFGKMFCTKNIIILAVLLVLSWGMCSYSNGKSSLLDGMTDPVASAAPGETSIADTSGSVSASPTIADPMQTVNSPSDLLPADSNAGWASLHPAGGLSSSNLLDPSNIIGISTTSQSFKNPNLQLRSDPYIEKKNVGPWMQSDILPDLYRTPLEIGQRPV